MTQYSSKAIENTSEFTPDTSSIPSTLVCPLERRSQHLTTNRRLSQQLFLWWKHVYGGDSHHDYLQIARLAPYD